MILTPLQLLPTNGGDWGKLIVAKCFKKLPKVQKFAQSGHSGCQQCGALLYRLFNKGTNSINKFLNNIAMVS